MLNRQRRRGIAVLLTVAMVSSLVFPFCGETLAGEEGRSGGSANLVATSSEADFIEPEVTD